jgi:hypothetical protein
MNDLERYFRNNTKRVVFKWHHYFEAYHQHFNRFRNQDVIILEIGVSQGGSLQMWKDYFGPKAKIYGVDIDPRCKQFEEENIEIFIGSQSDRNFLRNIVSKIPKVDILIDDGGHSMKQQIVTFEELFSHVKDNGVYLCEDCHTSYWWNYGGGYKRKNTFIEYSKNWIDYINAWHSKSSRLKVNDFTRTVKSIHYYDSIVVLEKGRVEQPVATQIGTPTLTYEKEKKTGFRLVKHLFYAGVNRMAAFLNLPFYLE